MRYFRVCDVEKLQHYKDRNPPWIKLHQDRLEDYDFASLPDVTKAHSLLIGLLASRTGNRLPFDARFIGAKINATEPVDLDLLVRSHCIELIAEPEQDASNALADREHSARPEEIRAEEIRAEAEGARAARVVTATLVRHPGRNTWLTPYADAWMARWGQDSEPPFAAMARPMKTAEGKLCPEESVRRWVNYLSTCDDVRFCNPAAFLKGLGQWTEAKAHGLTSRNAATFTAVGDFLREGAQ